MILREERKLLPSLNKADLAFCEHCIMIQQHMQDFGVETHSSKEFFEYTHSDLWVLSSIASLSQKLY